MSESATSHTLESTIEAPLSDLISRFSSSHLDDQSDAESVLGLVAPIDEEKFGNGSSKELHQHNLQSGKILDLAIPDQELGLLGDSYDATTVTLSDYEGSPLNTSFSTLSKNTDDTGYSPSPSSSDSAEKLEKVGGITFPALSELKTHDHKSASFHHTVSEYHGDVKSTEVDQSILDLIDKTNSRHEDHGSTLVPEALDAIRGGGVPNVKKSEYSTAPSETDITDNGNRLHTLKSQNRPRGQIDAVSQEDPLEERLLNGLQQTKECQEKPGFFPRDWLAYIIDEACVFEKLITVFGDVLDHATIRTYARQICGISTTDNAADEVPLTYKKIFAILVLSEKVSSIVKFLAENVSDDDLPLSKVPRQDKSSAVFYLGRRSDPGVPLKCFLGWSSIATRRFDEWQWPTTSPFFARSHEHKNVTHFLLQDQAILPFISDSSRGPDLQNKSEFEGGFSKVFRVEIHPQHHDFHDYKGADGYFAVKCLKSSDRQAFDREVDMLKKFSDNSHPHLISLLATYEQFKKFYLVFYCAKADLVQYWRDHNPNPATDHSTVLWMAQQCSGIADGLSRIHRYESSSSKDGLSTLLIPSKTVYGRHGDIKPANVLLFRESRNQKDIGTLILTDFGLSELNTLQSRSGRPNSDIGHSPSYRPPECDLQHGTIDRSYDIWTLGCLYLEFITWLLGGWDLVQKFNKVRKVADPMMAYMPSDTFFEIVHCKDTSTFGAMIKPAVTQFIAELHAHKACTDYIHDFLDLVQNHMMTVNPNDLLEDVSGRLTCAQVVFESRSMLRRCVKDAEYASTPTPWPEDLKNHKAAMESAVEADLPQQTIEDLRKKDLRVHSGKTQRNKHIDMGLIAKLGMADAHSDGRGKFMKVEPGVV